MGRAWTQFEIVQSGLRREWLEIAAISAENAIKENP